MVDTKKASYQDADEEKQTTIRLPKELRIRVATAAATHDTSLNQLVIDGLEIRLDQLDKKSIRKAS